MKQESYPLTSDESSGQPNANQGDNREGLDHSTIGEFKYALPHEYSHNFALSTTTVHDVSTTMEVSQNEKPLSALASTFLPKKSIKNSTAIEQDCVEDQQLNNKLLDPNRMLIEKLLTLLKLPCSQPLVPPEPSYVNMSNSVQNGDTDQSLTETTDISTMSDQVVIKFDETPLRNQSTDELKRPYSAECIKKSSIPNYNNDDIMLLCNEKVNTKSKKRRKTLQHQQQQQQQQSSIFQSNENNSISLTDTDDVYISVKSEPDSELSEANCSFATPAHPSACSSGKKKNQPKKFRDFRIPLTSDESSGQMNTNQEDNRGCSYHSTTGEFKYALPHEYSHNFALSTTTVHDVSTTMEVSKNEKPLSALASTFLPKNSIKNSTAIEQDCKEDQQMNNKLLDPNRMLIEKLLTLLKLPCSQPLVPPEPSYVNMSNSVQNGDTDQSLTETTDISTMSDQVVIKFDDAECIKKSSIPNYNNDDIMLLCNEKVNTKSKKRRKTLQHQQQQQQQQQSSIFQSNENNSISLTDTDDVYISVKSEPDSELSEANCSFATPAHPSACSSGKKKNQPKKFRDFCVKRRKHQH
ncbi:unnamed protein product [Trichobilharzia szidati]|nr:unnamed protein product [Trichobilharzia szidati]